MNIDKGQQPGYPWDNPRVYNTKTEYSTKYLYPTVAFVVYDGNGKVIKLFYDKWKADEFSKSIEGSNVDVIEVVK